MLRIILKKVDPYKFSVSILFGLLGFFLNFHTIIFPFGEYTAAILFGLLFPILITLSWGWKYGLLSAFAGGCQTMWWLWGPSNGYAILLVVPPFTLWVIWHGIFAELLRKHKTHKWWLSMYVVEIPFRILSSINLLTLSRWAITLNPPSWSWAAGAPNIIPIHFSVFVTIKQAAEAYIILLFADVVLNNNHVRRFFKLKEYIGSRKTGYIISAFLLLGCLFWLLDSVFYVFAFHKSNSFIDLFALDIPNYNIFTRTVFFVFCLVSGLITSMILRRQKESETAFRESDENFQQVVSNITTVIWKADIGKNRSFENTYSSAVLDELLELPAGTMKNDWDKYFKYIKPEYMEQVNNAFMEAAKSPESIIDCKYEVLKDNGQTAWFHSKGRCSKKNGKLYVFGSTADITKHKEVEESLQESEERYRAIVEHSSNGILIVNDDYKFIYVNNRLCEILGYPREEIIDHNFTEFIDEESKELVRGRYIRRQRGDIVSSEYEFKIVRKNGEKRNIEISSTIVKDLKGNILTVAQILDITEFKQTEDELKKYREHLEELVEKRTADLEEKNEELERYNKIFVGREFRIKELKDKVKELEKKMPELEIFNDTPVDRELIINELRKEINELLKELGEEPKYEIAE